jgi:hypothetical protein
MGEMIDVEVTIDELAIGGVGDLEARRIGQIVTSELERLLTDHGVPKREAYQVRMQVPVDRWPHDATPEEIGAMIAQNVYSALG